MSIISPDVGFLPQDFYNINLLVVPLWGLYANCIAQLISQFSSHAIIHYHRQISKKAMRAYTERYRTENTDEKVLSEDMEQSSTPTMEIADKDREECLCKHSFGRPHRGESEKLVARKWVGKALRTVVVVLSVLVLLGCSLTSFSLDVLGLIGVAVESGQEFEDAKTNHSIFTIIKLLFEEAQFLDTVGDYIGLGTLSVVLLFTVLIVPVLQATLLARQWFTPLTRKSRVKLSIFIESLQAWQYAEVYLIAIFVASWQLGPVSQFMINSYCDGLKESFAQMVYYGILKEEDAQCFSVQSSIEAGSYVLAVASLLLAVLNTFVNKAVVQYFRDKDEFEKRQIDPEETDNSWESEDSTSVDDVEESSHGARTSSIHPVPVLFTDKFRWTLRQEPNNEDGVEHRLSTGAQTTELPATILKGDESLKPIESSVEGGGDAFVSTDTGTSSSDESVFGRRGQAASVPLNSVPDIDEEPEIDSTEKFVQAEVDHNKVEAIGFHEDPGGSKDELAVEEEGMFDCCS